ncbi:MAG: DUF5683 domain-containing protein [Endomicrobium sp.]|jgi:hypothetical protein|nr:DUF5683 domain-containing protein [Endomicrobium sp.]
MRKFTICILCLLISVVPCFSDISLDLSTPKPGFVALRSAFIPGWGQAYNNQYTKAWIIFWFFALTAGGAIYFDKEASKKYDEYTAKGLVNDDSYNKYKTDTQISQISLAAAIVFYVFAIVDAYFMFDNKSYSSKLTAFNVYSQNDGLCLEYSYKI